MRILATSIILAAAAVITAAADDRLYIAPAEIAAGQSLQLELMLDNDTQCSGFQTDLFLPDGLIVNQEYDEYIIDLVPTRMARSHTLSALGVANGAIRIWVSSQQVASISGNTGAVATISVTAAPGFVKPAEIRLANSMLVEPNGIKHDLPEETLTIGSDRAKGDINDDGSVDGNDVSIMLEMVLAGGVTEAQLAVADINGDTSVDGNDVSILLEIVLSGE